MIWHCCSWRLIEWSETLIKSNHSLKCMMVLNYFSIHVHILAMRIKWLGEHSFFLFWKTLLYNIYWIFNIFSYLSHINYIVLDFSINYTSRHSAEICIFWCWRFCKPSFKYVNTKVCTSASVRDAVFIGAWLCVYWCKHIPILL